MAFSNKKDEVNWRFKKQLEKQKSTTKAYHKTILDRKLFNHSQNMDIFEWKEIREGDFWEEHDKLSSEFERNSFTLQRVLKYFKRKRR